MISHSPADKLAATSAAPRPVIDAAAVNTARQTPTCTSVRRPASRRRPSDSCAITTTWQARAAAASSISRSPRPGALNPPLWVSSATPTTATTAAAWNEAGRRVRWTRCCRSGVTRMVSEMISPALDADVMVTPNVSSVRITARIVPNTVPRTTSARVVRRSRGLSTTASPIAARANRTARNPKTVSEVATSLAAR